jgi:hypothetical protein
MPRPRAAMSATAGWCTALLRSGMNMLVGLRRRDGWRRMPGKLMCTGAQSWQGSSAALQARRCPEAADE